MTTSPDILAAARADALWIVRDRMHDVRVWLGEAIEHTPRHAEKETQ